MRFEVLLYLVGASILGATDAAKITNFQSMGCTGNKIEYNNVLAGSCCHPDRSWGGRMQSALFEQMTPSGIGSIYRVTVGQTGGGCGAVLKSTTPGVTCLSGLARGSMWQDAQSMLFDARNPDIPLPDSRLGPKPNPPPKGGSALDRLNNPVAGPFSAQGAARGGAASNQALGFGAGRSQFRGTGPFRGTSPGAVPGKGLGAFRGATRPNPISVGGARRPFKRDAVEEFASLPEGEKSRLLEQCQRSVLPDTLVLADGHRFSLGNSTAHHEHGEELMSLLNEERDLSIHDVPEHLHKYKI